MSHLHFTSTDTYGQRVIQMGEEPWRVTVSGAPGLDNLSDIDFLSSEKLADRVGLDLSKPFLIVTYHPVTLEFDKTSERIKSLLGALKRIGLPIVFTAPNADTYGSLIVESIDEFVSAGYDAKLVTSLGTAGYFSLMKHAIAMVGNSSSGIIEAASFELPVVNVGIRQRGRLHGANVIDVAEDAGMIEKAIATAISDEFRRSLLGLVNPYGDQKAAGRIVARLKAVEINDDLLIKRFHDLGTRA